MSGKNIVLCSDGTGNTAIKARGTNVFKLYEAVDIQGHKFDSKLTPQVAFYDDGVGTSKLAPMKLIGGAFGYGFGKNVRDLYTELAHVYEPGDHIYLSGFSRGAYTVRTLSGLIAYSGILDVNNKAVKTSLKQRIVDCWKDFRQEAFFKESSQGDPQLMSEEPKQDQEKREQDRKRRERYGAVIDKIHAPDGEVKVRFVGVWDTVGAVGMPFEELRTLFNWFWPMRFTEFTPSSCIEHACHALSIDDDRRTFRPELWNEDRLPKGQRVDQVWFAGVHSNVGGGYVKHGMSLVALDWMMAEAERCGLRFIERDREYVHSHQDVHDELYDARAGLGVYYRWQPRNIVGLCKDHNIEPKIHVSVVERIANGTDYYAPINLPHNFQVVGTRGKKTWPLGEALQKINEQVTHIRETTAPREKEKSLLDTMSRAINSGKWSYRVFAAASLYAAFMAMVHIGGAGYVTPPNLKIMAAISPWCPFSNWLSFGIYVCIGGLVWLWSKGVDKKIESVAQSHWRDHRKALRIIIRDSRIEQTPEILNGPTLAGVSKLVEQDTGSLTLK